jgi:hypothetical protein
MCDEILLPGDVRRPAAGVCFAGLQVSHAQHNAPQCDAGAAVVVDLHRCAENGLEHLRCIEPCGFAAHVHFEACKVEHEDNTHTLSHTVPPTHHSLVSFGDTRNKISELPMTIHSAPCE